MNYGMLLVGLLGAFAYASLVVIVVIVIVTKGNRQSPHVVEQDGSELGGSSTEDEEFVGGVGFAREIKLTKSWRPETNVMTTAIKSV